MAAVDKREALFWSKVDRRGDDECWPWGAGQTDGRVRYGQFHAPGLTGLAHRFSYWLAHGELPKEVSHSCDFGLCVNPKHLRAATHEENEAEKTSRGRRPTGTKGLPCPKCGGPQDGRSTRAGGRTFAFCQPCRTKYNRAYREQRRSSAAA